MSKFSLIGALLLAITASVHAEPTTTHALAMHGAPKYPADFSHFDYVNPAAPKGGKLRMAGLGTFDSLNQHLLKAHAAPGVGLLFDTMLTKSADEAFTEYGLVAESITMPENRAWVEFQIRPEAKFRDNTPITAEDVKFTFEILTTKGHPQYKFYYAGVSAVKVLSEKRVRYEFSDTTNLELPLIVGQLPILSKAYYEKVEFDQITLEAPMGSGPYRLKAVDAGRSITYELREDYWAKDLPVMRGHYNFKEIQVDMYRDSTVALEALKAGDYDYRLENVSKNWANAYDVPAVNKGMLIKAEIEHQIPSGMQAWVMNMRNPMFESEKVREALGYAFDFEWTNQNLFYGAYKRTDSFFENSELAAQGLPTEAELALLNPFKDKLPASVFTEVYTPPSVEGKNGLRKNLRKAKKLLKEAGWEVKDKKLTNKNTGQVMAFEILLNSPNWERISLPYIRNLEKLGIEATVRTVDRAHYKNRLDEFKFDMIVGLWGQSVSPGNEQRQFWSSAAANESGSKNFMGLKNEVVDSLIGSIIQAKDRESLIAACRALDRVLLSLKIAIPHWHIDNHRVAYWNKFGRPDINPPYDLPILETWWIDETKNNTISTFLKK